jgi:hypothetical protein
MDGITVVFLDATRKLTVSNHDSTTTTIPSITLSDPDTTSTTTYSSLYPASSPITSPAVSPNSSLSSSPANQGFLNSWSGGNQKNQKNQKNHTVIESHISWLTADYNTNEMKAARESWKTYKEIEKAMAGGLPSDNMYKEHASNVNNTTNSVKSLYSIEV